LSCDTKKFHDNESTHILHNFWTSTHRGRGNFPPPPLWRRHWLLVSSYGKQKGDRYGSPMAMDCRRLTARYSYAKAAFPRRFLLVGCRRMQMCAAWHSVVRSSVRQNTMNFVTETNNAVIAARGGTFSATVFFSGEWRTEYHLIAHTACIHCTANGCRTVCKVSIALSVCDCVSQVGSSIESSWFLARELPSTYPIMC